MANLHTRISDIYHDIRRRNMCTEFKVKEKRIRIGTPYEQVCEFAETESGDRMIQQSGTGEKYFTVINRYAKNLLEEYFYNTMQDAVRMVKEGYADDLYINSNKEGMCIEAIPIVYLNREYGKKIHEETLKSLDDFDTKYILKLAYLPNPDGDEISVIVPTKFDSYDDANSKVQYYAKAISMYFESIVGKDNYSADKIISRITPALVEKE